MNKFIFLTLILFCFVTLISYFIFPAFDFCNKNFGTTRIVREFSIMPFMDFVEKVLAARIREEVKVNPLYIKFRGGHLNHSRNLILKAARLSLLEQEGESTKKALVIGAGNCLDIPI